LIVSAGDHWSLRMSRQMAPVCDEMFGCQIFVRNLEKERVDGADGRARARKPGGAPADALHLRRLEGVARRDRDADLVRA